MFVALRDKICTLMMFVIACATPGVIAQDHVLTSKDLQRAVIDAASARDHDLTQLEEFFSSKQVAGALKTARVDSAAVRQAVAFLDDHELAQLSARAQQVQKDFAAGALTNQQLTYIVIALATAVIIIVIFEA